MKSSISALKLYKACRRAYELRYIEKLIPVQTADALQMGISYHDKIADLYNGCLDTSDLSKESAMAVAYQKYVYPEFPVNSVEEWVNYSVGKEQSLIGRIDARTPDGILVEHKTTSGDVGDEYEYDLQWDEQILAYMLATGARMMYYTIIKKPTIRAKKGESEQEFFDRMVAWYDEDTNTKIRVLKIQRTDEEIEAFRKDTEKLMQELEQCKLFYRNTAYCNKWGRRCEYASVCLNYDPKQEYIEFTKGR